MLFGKVRWPRSGVDGLGHLHAPTSSTAGLKNGFPLIWWWRREAFACAAAKGSRLPAGEWQIVGGFARRLVPAYPGLQPPNAGAPPASTVARCEKGAITNAQ